MCICLKSHFLENLFCGIYTCQNAHLAECTFPPKTYFSELHLPECKLHLAEYTFPRKLILQNLHLPECTFGRNYISPKSYFPEFSLSRMYIWPKLHFSENLFYRIYTCQNVHLAEYTFPQKLVFQKLYTFTQNFVIDRIHITKIYKYACSFSKINELRVEWKEKRKVVSHVLQLILTNNVRLKIFLVFDKNKCHFQNRTILPKFVMIF